MRSIREAAAALRARKVSCVELVQNALEAEKAHRDLNCFITLTGDQALEHAKVLDAELASGRDRGPLHGIPVAHKDLYFTAGVRTTNGTKLFADFVPDHDSAAVANLREAGATSIGKLNQHELAYGITSTNPHYGPVRNPHDPTRIPGGSSGGSGAAVAAGIVLGSTGSDTGGSIRIPASFCGVVGFKPTFGTVSTAGCFPLGVSLDHMGPLAATVEDTAWLLEAMAEAKFPVEPNIGLRIGIPENFYVERAQPEVLAAVQDAAKQAERLGAKLVPVRVPDPEELVLTARKILLCEAASVMTDHLHRRDDFGMDVLVLLETGSAISVSEYIQAHAVANAMRVRWARLFEDIDLLLAPSTPTTAPLIGRTTICIDGVEEDTRLLSTRFCRGINVLGYPAISIPYGSAEGLPIGLQIIGGMNQDTRVLGAGAALQ